MSYLLEEQHEEWNKSLPEKASNWQKIARKTSISQPPSQIMFFNTPKQGPLLVSLGDKSLHLEEVQKRLDGSNLTELIVKIIKKSPPHRIVMEAVKLAVALLEGGNRQVQVYMCTCTLHGPVYMYMNLVQVVHAWK